MTLAALLALLLAGCSGTDGGSTNPSASPSGADASSGGGSPTVSPLPAPTDPPNTSAVSAVLVGLRQGEAEARAQEAGYTTRIASVDGQPRPLTMDYSVSRINLELVDGKVVSVTVG